MRVAGRVGAECVEVTRREGPDKCTQDCAVLGDVLSLERGRERQANGCKWVCRGKTEECVSVLCTGGDKGDFIAIWAGGFFFFVCV